MLAHLALPIALTVLPGDHACSASRDTTTITRHVLHAGPIALAVLDCRAAKSVDRDLG